MENTNMKRTKDELLKSLKEIIGEDESENTIAFLEDFSDSFADNSEELVEVTNKYNSLKKRYKEGFFGEGDDGEKSAEDENEEEKKEIKIKDLFTEE